MEGMMNMFPFNLFDKKWYHQSIVAKTSATTEIPTPPPQVENGEITESLAAVDLNDTKGHVETEASNEAMPTKPITDKDEMRRVFEKFDENNDGVICSNDLKRYMEKLGFEMSEEELTTMMRTVDNNEDGTVDFDEFHSLYKQITGSTSDKDDAPEDDDDSLLEAFQIFDKNQDGFITAPELQKVLVSLGMPEGNSLMKCQKMIEGVDADGNGQVDFKEFKKMMNSNGLQLA